MNEFYNTYNMYRFSCINIKSYYYILGTITSYYIEGIQVHVYVIHHH
jgi:hypothetical protein